MAATQLNVSKETLIQSFTALDTAFEQTVEKDLVLPDYCPDVFRILKCRIIPKIVSQSINGDKLTIETEAVIKVMYLNENSGRINLIEQKLNYSKTLELGGEAAAPIISACAKTEHISCRVVNQRRVDIRGSFTVKVKVTAEQKKQFITGAQGAGIQLKKVRTVYPAKRLTAAKRVTVVEELELGGAKPPVGTVLRTDCVITQQERKVISGKLIVKGEAAIDMLYIPADSNNSGIETMRFGIPYSQVIDIEGVDESYMIDIDIKTSSCDLIPRTDDGTGLECELVMLVNCIALKYESCDAVTDAFSTKHNCTVHLGDSILGADEEKISLNKEVCGKLCCNDGEISGISSVWCEVHNVTVREGEEKSVVSGSVLMSAIGMNSQEVSIYLENEVPFECETSSSNVSDVQVTVRSCSYHLSDAECADVKAELLIETHCSNGDRISPLDEISIDETGELSSSEYALKLFSAETGEKLWDIAKQCRTSVEAIIEENDLTSDIMEESGMLLIPIIN
ncbi:MAG: DUF3794 domain-containing protein [Ruminococcus sp.]|nr:DUF3794 domain-containing protein [Ruminococcus sp.]